MGEPARALPRIFPQRLQYAFAEVGQPVAEFRPSPLRVATCIVGGVLLACAAVAAAGFLLFTLDDGLEEVLTAVAAAGIFGVLLAVGVWRVIGQRWLVCPGGLVRARGRQVEYCLWEQVHEIREAAGQSPLGTVTYTVRRKEGEDWTIDANAAAELDRFAQLLREAAGRHAIRWEKVAAKSSSGD